MRKTGRLRHGERADAKSVGDFGSDSLSAIMFIVYRIFPSNQWLPIVVVIISGPPSIHGAQNRIHSICDILWISPMIWIIRYELLPNRVCVRVRGTYGRHHIWSLTHKHWKKKRAGGVWLTVLLNFIFGLSAKKDTLLFKSNTNWLTITNRTYIIFTLVD